MNYKLYQKIIVLFWLLWWLIAFVTDFLGGLYQLKIVKFQWAVESNNYAGLINVLKIFNPPHWVSGILYLCIIVWLFVIVVYFCKAAYISLRNNKNINIEKEVNIAFLISMLLWLAFFLADQLILNFGLEENHMVQGGFELLSWIALYIFFKAEQG